MLFQSVSIFIHNGHRFQIKDKKPISRNLRNHNWPRITAGGHHSILGDFVFGKMGDSNGNVASAKS